MLSIAGWHIFHRLKNKAYRLRFAVPVIVLLLVAVAYFSWKPVRNQVARQRHPYVVLISIDTLHVGYTSLYNEEVQETPHLEDMAQNGIVFRNAYTRVPITLPSHTALLSGVLPVELGVMANGDVVPERITTLAEVFRDAGYQTAGFVSLGVLRASFGLDQGFDHFDDPFRDGDKRPYRTADEVLDSVKDWLGRSGREPFFIWVHFSDPHEPYIPVGAPPDTRLRLDEQVLGEWNLASKTPVSLSFSLPPGDHRLTWTSLRKARPDDRSETSIRLHLYSRKLLGPYTSTPLPDPTKGVDLKPDWGVALSNPENEALPLELQFNGKMVRPPPSEVLENYRLEVAYTDRYVGELRRLFRSLDIEDEILWVIVSDHGEGLFHHDTLGHAADVFEDQLRLLWLLMGPGLPSGKAVDGTPALMVDVAPTLLDWVGLAPPVDMEGISRVGCWSEGPCPDREAWWAYGLNHDTNRLTAMAGYRWPYKWIWKKGRGRQAHLLSDDPWEEKDLLELPGRERPSELKLMAEEFREQRYRLAQPLRLPRRLLHLQKNLELLRALGYIDTK